MKSEGKGVPPAAATDQLPGAEQDGEERDRKSGGAEENSQR